MKHVYVTAATLILVALGCSSEDPATTITVDCGRAPLGDISVECDDNVNGDGSVHAEETAETPEACGVPLAAVGAWVGDDHGEASIGPVVLLPNGEKWRFSIDVPGGVVTRVEVPVRPFIDPPVAPLLPATIAILGGNQLSDEWTVNEDASDDPLSPSYQGPRSLSVDGLELEGSPSYSYQVRIQAPLANDDAAGIVVMGVPYLTVACP